MGVGTIFGTHLGDLGSRSLSYWSGTEFTCPHDIVRTAHPIITKLVRYSPFMMFSPDQILEEFCQEFFFCVCECFRKISNPIFPKSNILFAISYEWLVQLMWNKKEMSQLDAVLTGGTFDLKFSRSNCISGMGGRIIMGRKGRESIGCPDMKHNHYVTLRQRILLGTGMT